MSNISTIKGDQLITSSLAVGHPTTFAYDNDNLNVLDLSGSLIVRGTGSVPVAPQGAGIIYYDPATQKIKVSENGGVSSNLVGNTGGAIGQNKGPQVGQNIYDGNQDSTTLNFRRLLPGTGINLLSGSDTVMISFTGSAGSGITSSAGINLTIDNGLYAGNSDLGTLKFRTLIPGAGINFVSSSTTLTLFTTITSSGQGGGITSSAGINSGSGQGIYKGNSDLGTLQFRTLTSDNSINFISGSETLMIATTDWKQTGSVLSPFTADTINIAGSLNSTTGIHSNLTGSFLTGSRANFNFISGSSLSISGSANIAGHLTASNIFLNVAGTQQTNTLGLRNNDAILKILAGATEADGAAFLMSGKNFTGSPFKGGIEYTIGNLAGSHFIVQSYDFSSTWEYRFILNGDTGHTWIGLSPQNIANGTGLVAVGHPLGFTPTTTLDISGTITTRDLVIPPAVSPAHSGRIYYDRNAEKYKVSENGGAYTNLVGGGGGITSSAGINIGSSGEGLYAGNSDLGTLQFRRLIAGSNVSFVSSSTDITINATAGTGIAGTGMWNPTTSSLAFFNSVTSVTGSANFTLNNNNTVMQVTASNGFFFSGSIFDLKSTIDFEDISSGSIFPTLQSQFLDNTFLWADANTSKMKIWEYRDPLASETIYPSGAAGNITTYPDKQGHGSWLKPVYIHTTGTYPNADRNTLYDIPGLWVALKPRKKYKFEFVIAYKSPVTTANGIRVGLASGAWGAGIPSVPNGNAPIEYWATVTTATGMGSGSIGSLTSLNRINSLGTGTFLSTTAVAVAGSTYQSVIKGYIQTGTGSINLSAIYAPSVVNQQITVTSSYAEIDELNVRASG